VKQLAFLLILDVSVRVYLVSSLSNIWTRREDEGRSRRILSDVTSLLVCACLVRVGPRRRPVAKHAHEMTEFCSPPVVSSTLELILHTRHSSP